MSVLAAVLDTNVAVVANGRNDQASPECVSSCVNVLIRAQGELLILLDSEGLILEEYRRHLRPSGEPGLGDAFFKWIWDNQANPRRCRTVPITSDTARGFVEFPEDLILVGFDRSDRKFVAVALASGVAPTVFNATDTDWWIYRAALEDAGVVVSFVCPELMQRTRGRDG